MKVGEGVITYKREVSVFFTRDVFVNCDLLNKSDKLAPNVSCLLIEQMNRCLTHITLLHLSSNAECSFNTLLSLAVVERNSRALLQARLRRLVARLGLEFLFVLALVRSRLARHAL